MRTFRKGSNPIVFLVLAVSLFSFSSCLTSRNLDKFIATRYNNELPRLNKKKSIDININPASANSSVISTSVHKTDKLLPLLIYWKYNHRQSCSLNSYIAVVNFSNSINSLATKGLTEKLNGRKLELAVEQAPAAFSIVVKENMIWLIYVFGWAKVYIEPDAKDLVVSYKLLDGGATLKTGTITVKNNDKNKGLRYFQSWQSATSEYLTDYSANITSMTKAFVAQLTQEL